MKALGNALKFAILIICLLVPPLRAVGESPEDMLNRMLPRLSGKNVGVIECPYTDESFKPGNEGAKLSCDFMKRSPPPRGQKENWGLDLTGADLMREHPLVLGARTQKNYPTHQVAVVDTGLKIDGNPLAGNKLVTSSPEVDYFTHGTHVTGIIASEKFGVNPSLSIKSYPVKYQSRSAFESQGFDDAELINQIDAAIQNPDVSVINLSLSSFEDSRMEALLKEAVKKGKWVVYGAGNEKSATSDANAGLRELQKDPGVAQSIFSIGALSALGAPAGYSNFGSGVDYYAPGSAIDSLSANYNSNLVDENQRVRFSGTSMAAPHFTAVLATMKAIAPTLTIQDARKILDLTSIQLGVKPIIKQVNAFGAIELLEKALACTEKTKKALSECIAQARADADRECKEESKAALPNNCSEARIAYSNARKKFFSCAGRGPSRQELLALIDLLTEPMALERAAYQPAEKFLGALFAQKGLRSVLSKEEKAEFGAAVDFYTGKFVSLNVNQGIKTVREDFKRDPEGSLNRLELRPENAELFYEACQHVFVMGARDVFACGERCLKLCESRLSDSSSSFKSVVYKKAMATGDKISDDILYIAEQLDVPDAELQNVYLRYFTGPYPLQPDWRDASTLLSRLDGMSPKVRAAILERLKNSKSIGARAKAWLLTNDELNQNPNLKAQVVNHFAEKDKDVQVANLRLASTRLRAGHVTPAQYGNEFRALLGKVTAYPAKDKRDINSAFGEFADDRFNSGPIVLAMRSSPLAKKEILKVLAEPDNLKKLETIGDMPMVLMELSKGLGAEDSETLYNALLSYYGDKRFAPGWNNGTLYSMLSLLSKENPYLKAELDKLLMTKQANPTLQTARVEYLTRITHDAETSNQYVQALLAEDPQGFESASRNVSPKLILSDPMLKARWIEAVRKATVAPKNVSDTDPETTSYGSTVLGWASRAVHADFKEAGRVIIPNLANMAKASPWFDDYDLKAFVTRAVEDHGNDPSVIRPLIDQIEILSKDKPFMNRALFEKKTPQKWDTVRGRAIIEAVQLIGMSKAGEQELQKRPELMHAIVEFMTATESMLGDQFSYNYPVPVAAFDPLNKKIESTKFDPEANLPTWVNQAAWGSVQCLDATLLLARKYPSQNMTREVSFIVKKGLLGRLEWATPERLEQLEILAPESAQEVRQALKERSE